MENELTKLKRDCEEWRKLQRETEAWRQEYENAMIIHCDKCGKKINDCKGCPFDVLWNGTTAVSKRDRVSE